MHYTNKTYAEIHMFVQYTHTYNYQFTYCHPHATNPTDTNRHMHTRTHDFLSAVHGCAAIIDTLMLSDNAVSPMPQHTATNDRTIPLASRNRCLENECIWQSLLR